MPNIEQPDQILHQLLQIRSIGYAMTNCSGEVTIAGGDSRFIDPPRALGQPISAVVPELLGSEDELQAILDGERSSLHLPLINRDISEDAQGSHRDPQHVAYVNIYVLPRRHSSTQDITGFSVFAEEATEEGAIQQRIMQQRNELTLLHDQIEQQNRQLQAANQELRQLNDLKSRFVAVAAHELRTPLTTISGYTELLSDGSFGTLPEQQRPLEIISHSTTRLLTIINDLLDISRIEAGRTQLHLRPVPLATLVRHCLEEERLHIETRDQSITLDLPASVPLLLCDEVRTMQILGNLVNNASKYTPEGGKITLSAAPATEEGYLQVTISDSGIGIPPADQDHIFETFYRASNVNAIDAIGAGLGLSITRALVELQGGEIWCESASGQGATFTFTIPLAE